MKGICAVLSLAGLVLPVSVALASEGYDGLAKLAKAGVGEEVLLAHVEAAPASFGLSADEVVRLKDLGVPSRVIVAAIKHGKAVPADAARRGDFNACPLTRVGNPSSIAAPPPAAAQAAPVVAPPPPSPVTVVQVQAPAPVVVQEPARHDYHSWCWRPGVVLGLGFHLGHRFGRHHHR